MHLNKDVNEACNSQGSVSEENHVVQGRTYFLY